MSAWRGRGGVLATPRFCRQGRGQNLSGCISWHIPSGFLLQAGAWSGATGLAAPSPVTHRLVSRAEARRFITPMDRGGV